MRNNANWLFVFLLGMALLLGCGSANAITPQISAGAGTTVILKQDGTIWGVGTIHRYWPAGALQPTRVFPAITDAKHIGTEGEDYALRANGELWARGDNKPTLDGVVQFDSSFGWTTIALKSDGTVWAWGPNTFGQVGDGTRTPRLTPVQITGLANVVMVAAGDGHVTALTADGHVWVWGSRLFFADGDPSWYPSDDPRSYVLTPRQLPNLSNIVSIASGSGNLALDASGKLWSHGAAWTGTLGNGTTENAANLAVPVSIPGKVKAYSIGWGHALAVTEDGSVWVWGTNTSGQLGVPFSKINPTPAKLSLPGPAVNVAAGWNHSAVLLADGSVMTFGDDSSSQLGRGLFQSDYVPGFMVSETGSGNFSAITSAPANLADAPSVRISAPSAVDGTIKGFVPLTASLTANGSTARGRSIVRYDWVSSDGSLQAEGPSVSLNFTQPGVVDVYAIATDNTGLKSAALQRIMPLPPDVPVSVAPQIVTSGNTFNTLSNTGVVYSWGGPWQLGSQAVQFGNGPQGARVLPVDPGLRGIVKLASADGTSFGLTQGGIVLAWGFNTDGALGIGSTLIGSWDPVLVGLPKAATDIASGASHHAFALLNDGTVWAWGGNGYGQLGLADTAARNRPVQVPGLANITKIFASQRNGYAIDQNGSVWAWGDNSQYQLGQGDSTPRLGMVKVNGLPPIAKLAASDSHVLAIAHDGRVFGWSSWHVLLGDTTLPSPVASPMQVPALSGFTDFASNSYTLGVKSDGSIWAWGNNFAGGLPGSTNPHEASPIKIPGLSHPVAMTLSYSGGAIVLNNGNVVTWGQNDYGQIGDGTLARRRSPVLVANSTADGYLNLIPGTTANAPPELQVPFFTVASGEISATSATVSTATKFNAADAGKSGAVYVTAMVPSGSLVAQQAMGRSKALSLTALATSGASSFVQVQLTPSGWQQVVNGQLIPYASGVLGDQLAMQTILSGTDTTNLKGAEFCVGYGTSAEEMTAAGRMRAVATIPDPNATSTVTVSCVIQGGGGSTTVYVTEFYNTNLDNYFITADANEAAQIDGGSAGPGWSRTGNSFKSGGSASVCRFYGSYSPGPNSHFYTVDPAECQGLKDQQIPTGDPSKLTSKSWNYESLDFVSTVPSGGACPGGTTPVYRAYNNGYSRGVDSNHRITSSLSAINEVVTRGWNNEGVVMCAPN